MLKHTPLAHTQTAVRSQAVAPYPKSFNDHKETPWQAPKGAAIVPMLLPMEARCLKQTRAAVEVAIPACRAAGPRGNSGQPTLLRVGAAGARGGLHRAAAATRGSPERPGDPVGRRGLRCLDGLRWIDQHPGRRPPCQERPVVQPVPHNGAVCSDEGGAFSRRRRRSARRVRAPTRSSPCPHGSSSRQREDDAQRELERLLGLTQRTRSRNIIQEELDRLHAVRAHRLERAAWRGLAPSLTRRA